MSTASLPEVDRKQPARGSRLWAIWIVPSALVAGYAIVQYLIIPPSQGHFFQRLLLLQIHAGAGALTLLTGPWQFWTWVRQAHRTWHRWLGRLFLLAVTASSWAGFSLSFFSEEGWATHLGFGSLAVAWFWTALMGYRTARQNQFRLHREWLVRCFSLALAAVTLRIELLALLTVAHFSFHAAYITVSWLSWIPNLLVAEWWLRRGVRRQAIRGDYSVTLRPHANTVTPD